MTVRNFWFNAFVDGRMHPLSSGPQRREGGMSLQLRQRWGNGTDSPSSLIVCALEAHCDRNGELTVTLRGAPGSYEYLNVPPNLRPDLTDGLVLTRSQR